MADLLGEVDTNIPLRQPMKPIKNDSRRKIRVLSPPMSQEKPTRVPKQQSNDRPIMNTPPLDMTDDYDDLLPNFQDENMSMSDPLPSSPIEKAIERKGPIKVEAEDDDDDMMEVFQAFASKDLKLASVNMSGSRPVSKIVKKEAPYPSPESSSPTRPPADTVDPAAWNDVTSRLNVLSSQGPDTTSFGKVKIEDAVEGDGTLRMFWTDYTEVNGSLCLFGKVKDKKSNNYVSAFVKIDNVLRKLFFLPRTYRQRHGRDTSEEVEMAEVYQEVDELMTRLRVGMHKIKPCSRKYAFELPDIPREAGYLKLMYPYDKPSLPFDLKGETFSHAFGTNTALFEQFVLWKRIMGPCWLKIDEADLTPVNNASWCKFEVQVASPKSVTVLNESDNLDAPPLTFMSISLRTMLNVKENKQEILVASARVYENISLTDMTSTEDLPCKTYTIMRPADAAYPTGFEALTKKQRGKIMTEKSEQMLLSKFLALLERIDPDVLMGHQLQDVDYPILLSRMRERKTAGWHRIGRMKRGEWPKNMGKGGNSFFSERQLIAGRLLCDVANDMGKVCSRLSRTDRTGQDTLTDIHSHL